MQIHGYVVEDNDEVLVFVGLTPDEARHQLADWVRENYKDLADSEAPADTDEDWIDFAFDGNEDAGYVEFTEDLPLGVGVLRELYTRAVTEHLQSEDIAPGWLDDEMQLLNDGLPYDWYVYSREELAAVREGVF